MSPLVPSPDTIPVPWGYFKFLLMLTFGLHLLLMNALVGSTGIALYARLRGDETHRQLAADLAKTLPVLVAFTVNLGVAPLLFIQVLYGQFFYASSIVMAAFWLAVVPLLVLAYSAAYVHSFRFDALGRAGAPVLGLALLAFLAIAFIYSNNMTMMLDPRRWQAWFADPRGTVLALGDPALLPRYLHVMLGAAAVGGLFVALLGKIRRWKSAAAGELAARLGVRVFSAFTAAAIVTGFWFLAALPRDVMLLFLGRSAAATALFAAGLLLAILAPFAAHRGKIVPAAALAAVLVYAMAFLRDIVRTGFLAPVFSPDRLAVAPQYGPMLLFAATLVAGASALAWLAVKAKQAFTAAPRE